MMADRTIDATEWPRANAAQTNQAVRSSSAALRQLPLVLLGGLLIFAPLAFGAVEPWSIAVLEIGAGAAFLFWAVMVGIAGEVEIIFSPLLLPVVAFGLFILAQLIAGISAYAYVTWTELLKYVAYAMSFFIVVQCLRTRKELKIFAGAATVFGFLLATFAIIQQFTSPGKLYWTKAVEGWIYGPYVNHNHYAGLMEMLAPVPIVLSLYSAIPGAKRVMLGFAGTLMWSSIFLSGSRGGMLAVLVEAALFGLWLYVRRSGRSATAGFVALIVVVLVLLAWWGGLETFKRFGTVYTGWETENNLGRFPIYRDSLRMFIHKPLAGWGLGTFPVVYPEFRSVYGSKFINQAHNDYLGLLIETGILGFGVLLWFLFTFYSRALAWLRLRSGLQAVIRLGAIVGCTGLLVHSFLDFNLHIPANALWFYVLCAIATAPVGSDDRIRVFSPPGSYVRV